MFNIQENPNTAIQDSTETVVFLQLLPVPGDFPVSGLTMSVVQVAPARPIPAKVSSGGNYSQGCTSLD